MKPALTRILALLRIRHDRILFFRLDLDAATPDPAAPAGGPTIERVTPEAARMLKDYEDAWLTRADMTERIRQGNDLFIVHHNGEKASYNWALYGRFFVASLDHAFELPEGGAYLSGAYTRPAFRRLGLSRLGYAHILAYLRRRGIRTVFLNVAADNEPSLGNVRKLSFRDYQQADLLRLGIVRLYRLAGPGGVRRFACFSRRPNAPMNRAFFTDFMAGHPGDRQEVEADRC
ncbi:MAG: GNAT family N-acetyltransferase [bacterium]|nr:GNAT family N-acetyltransferase [bacterium]